MISTVPSRALFFFPSHHLPPLLHSLLKRHTAGPCVVVVGGFANKRKKKNDGATRAVNNCRSMYRKKVKLERD